MKKVTKVPMKTASQHVSSASKYVAGSSIAALSIAQILVHLVPGLEPVSEPILTLLTITINLASIYVIKRWGESRA